MKTTFLVILLCIIPFQMFAQLEQGTFLFGGGLSANSTHEEYSGDFFGDKYEVDELGFSFYPEVGYFVIENFAFGLNAKIGASRLTYNNNQPNQPETNTDSFEYLLGPYIRYYYPIKPFALFCELNYQFGNISQTYELSVPDGNGEYTIEEVNNDADKSIFSTTIGVEYFITNSVGLSAALRYEIGKSEYNSQGIGGLYDYYYEFEHSGFVFLVALQIHLNFSETD